MPGPVPEGKELDKRALPDDLNPAKEGTIASSESLGRPVRFIFDYPYGQYAGPRHWNQVKEGVWIETYPDGNIFIAFRETGRMKQDGCEGIVVERQDNAGFKVFIPDRGCKNMRLWWQAGTEN